jgi:hypothetical protein
MHLKGFLRKSGSYTKSRSIFLFALSLYLIGIPFSRFLMSAAGVVLVINWLFEEQLRERIKKLFHSKIALACLLLYFVHIIWLIPSQNIHYGMIDLWIKIPLFFIPFIFFTSKPLSSKEFQLLLQLYLMGTFISSFIGFMVFQTGNLVDKRETALYISYIRFEINLCYACFVSLFLFFKNNQSLGNKIIFLIAFAWFFFVMVYLGAVTALILFFLVGAIIVIRTAIRSNHTFFCYFVPALFIVALVGVSSYVYHTVRQYFDVDFSIETAAKYTDDGNLYLHCPEEQTIENGSYIYTYISYIELEPAWNSRSKINYNDMDSNGFPIKTTLIRYLNSKGLTKDRKGVASLTDADIFNIEQGIANVVYSYKLSIVGRLYALIWEINDYWRTGSVVGYSLPQRLELWKQSLRLIKKHPWFGVGTGDVKDAFAQELELNNSPLAGTNLRSHNQYFTFLIAFGGIGLAFILFSIFYPVVLLPKTGNPLFLLFFSIFLLSMFSEDMMEPQDGVTFFVFFYAFFLFLLPSNNTQSAENHTV